MEMIKNYSALLLELEQDWVQFVLEHGASFLLALLLSCEILSPLEVVPP